MRIETERLIIREFTEDDYDDLYAIVSDPETMQHYPAPWDEEKAHHWITWNMENYRNHGFGLGPVILKETGEMIGNCGISIQNIGGQLLPEVGYQFNKKFWHKGYASEAARAARDYAFENTEYDRIYSYMKYTNIGSYSTAMLNGMHKVDEFDDEKNIITKVFCITRKEWEYEQIIRKYFKSWIDKDTSVAEKYFAENIEYSESYGPQYHGKVECLQWMKEWFEVGKVNEWSSRNVSLSEKRVFIEWYFNYEYKGEQDEFNGVSIFEFNTDGLIYNVREFASEI